MKLTNTIRDNIIKRIVNEKKKCYEDSIADLRDKIVITALDLKWKSIPANLRVLAKELPRTWLVESSRITLYSNTQALGSFTFVTDYFPLTFAESKYNTTIVLRLSSHVREENELIQLVSEYSKKQAVQENYTIELKRELLSLLNSVTTVKRLEMLWPEGEKYYKDLILKSGVSALIANPERVNSLINR